MRSCSSRVSSFDDVVRIVHVREVAVGRSLPRSPTDRPWRTVAVSMRMKYGCFPFRLASIRSSRQPPPDSGVASWRRGTKVCRGGLTAGIDHAIANGGVFGPAGNQSPSHEHHFSVVVGVLPHDRHVSGWERY